MKHYHFNKLTKKDNAESYLHYSSKFFLSEWLVDGFKEFPDIYETRIEEKIFIDEENYIIPDITCYDIDGHIKYLFEVVYKSEVIGAKINKIQKHKYYYNLHYRIFEVDSEYILTQLSKPEKLTVFEIV